MLIYELNSLLITSWIIFSLDFIQSFLLSLSSYLLPVDTPLGWMKALN